MSLEPCRECGREVSTEAIACAACGAPAPTRVTDDPTFATAPKPVPPGGPPRDRRAKFVDIAKWTVGVLVFVVIGGAGLAALTQSPTESGPAPTTPSYARATAGNAKAVCHDLVRQRSKAPVTAEFVRGEEGVAEDLSLGGWRVTGIADARDTYGAQTRNRFVCVVRYRPDVERWQTESLLLFEGL